MNYYRELVEELRSRMRLASIDALWPDTVEKYFKEAADAIEQLVKERDEANIRAEHKCDTCKNNFKWEWRGV